MQVVLIGAENVADLVGAFETMKKEQFNGLFVQADALFIQKANGSSNWRPPTKMPAIYRLGEQATAGGFMAYGPSIPYMYRQGALFRRQILEGREARPISRSSSRPKSSW